MRGDLVYEKLGEIDPELLADALPPAAVTPPLYQLGSNQPMRPPRGPRVRKVVLICACILLAGLLLAGGTVALSRAWEGFFEETTPEDHFGKELTYRGTVSIGGFGSLMGSDELEVIGNELKAIFTAAAPVEDMCECLRDLSIQIGDTTLTYNRDHGCFRDGDTGLVYQLREQDKEYVNDLLTDLESLPQILSFFHEYTTLRHGDDFVFTVAWWEEYGSIYKIDKVYLRYDGEDTEYVTPGFFTVSDQESTYRIRIKDDAPYGKYTLVAHVYSPYTGRNIDMEIPSVPGAVEIVPFASEPSYTFSWNSDRIIYSQGETILVDVAMTNNGDPILRWTKDSAILPEVSLRSVSNGKTYPMSREQEIDWSGQLAGLDSGAASKGEFLLGIPSSMPVGVYDLVLSFEGHEKVIENVLEVNDTLVLCRGDSYGLFVSQAEPSTFVLRQGDYEIPFGRWDNLPVVTIPADAPAGSYDLVENGYLSFEGFLIVSDAENEHFSHNDLRKQTVQRGDWVEFDACVNVKGATIHAFMPYDSLDIEAVLVSIYGSPTSYTLTAMSAPDAREPNNYTFYPGETIIKSKTFIIPDDMPAGVYDLVVTFRGETKTYPKMITVVAP